MRGHDARRAGGRLALVGLLAAGLVGGCSTPVDRERATDTPPSPSSSPAADAGPEEAEIGPVSQMLASLRGLVEESEADRRRRVEAVEAAVAACMAEQGFTYEPTPYVPMPATSGEPPVAQDEDGPGLGYGIAAGAAGTMPAPPGAVVLVDPNASAVEAMSDAERTAWDLTLYGPGQGEAYAAGEEPYDWTRYGCYGRAQHDVPGAIRPQFDASAFATLEAEIRAMVDAVATDPALAETVGAWSACMADAGYPGYTGTRQPMDEIQDASGVIWQETYGSAALDLSTDDYTTSAAYLEAQAEYQRRHAELAATEVPLAEADRGCLEEVGYAEARAAAALAAERAFFATHQAELEAYRAAHEEFAASLGDA
ncbi:hypothetical protein [Actinotalea solisilvae]|uniref:hypothetical protein n=1 Tax=Actinotalea solisilvae TaxID=2072922 RepID=UPI0018F10928|nr:hypothetical protein [Actinotalea solisilvae]